mgnify:CR=1 FL=1
MTPEEQAALEYFYEELESYDEDEQGEIFDLYDN